MHRSISNRLNDLEKKMVGGDLVILKFSESDVEQYVEVCRKWNDRYPSTVSFSHTESEDIQEIGKCWMLNIASILSHCVIQESLGDPGPVEWFNKEFPLEDEG